MAVNFQHLRSFYAIACDQSVSRAARRINVSQPTLSKQLKALEDYYQVKLIEGSRPPLTLTEAGEQLFKKAQDIFGIAEDIDALLRQDRGDRRSLIRLGTDSPPYAAEFIAAYKKAAPDTDFKVTIANARATNDLLLNAQIDVAIVCEPEVHPEYLYTPLYQDHLVAVVPRSWDKPAPFDLSCLTDETLLIREETSRTLASMSRILSESAITPKRVMEFHTREMIREAVAESIGVSFMFARECPPDERLRTLEIDTGSTALSVSGFLAVRAERRRKPAIKQAIETANSIAAAAGLS